MGEEGTKQATLYKNQTCRLFLQVGQSATYVEALNTARAAAVQIYKVDFTWNQNILFQKLGRKLYFDLASDF